MFLYSDEYKHTIAEAWRSYIKASEQGKEMDPELRSAVRPEVFGAWERSRQAGVSPYVFKAKKIVGEDLTKVLEENATLISASRQYIENLYLFLSGINFVVILTDSNGIVLYIKNEDSITKERTDVLQLSIGSLRGAEYAGSNAMSECLCLGKPIQ